MGKRALIIVLAGLTVTLSVPEFVKVQRLKSQQLRERFHLPKDCEPTVLALRASPGGKMTVVISCVDEEPEH